jgi:prepilin-type N-terminal cleavage/methylation domain-containing protein
MLKSSSYHRLKNDYCHNLQVDMLVADLNARLNNDLGLRSRQSGFTLIEIMLVVVIAGIFAAMVGLSIGGSDLRRVMQEREELIGSIAEIRLESQDQGRLLGLVSLYQSATEPARYIVVEYDPKAKDKDKQWIQAEDFKPHPLPEGLELTVTPLQPKDTGRTSIFFKNITSGELSPKLIWFGNGEATAARLQLLQEGKKIGDAVEVTSLGQVKKDDSRMAEER